MSLSVLSRRSAVVPRTRSRTVAVAPALVKRVDVFRSPRLVQARSNLPTSDEATETQAVDKANAGHLALGVIGALALSGAISIATGIVPTSALAGPGASYKIWNVTTYNNPPALIDYRFNQANLGCNPEVTRNSSGLVTDLKFVYVTCPSGVTCTPYPYPYYDPLYEVEITSPKVSAATNPPPYYSDIWIRCFT